MNISQIMDKDHIIEGLAPISKRQLLQELSEAVAEFINIDDRTIFDALLERENLGTTGFGGGTAVPHARIAKLDKPVVIFTKLEVAIDFQSVDNKPVDLIFLLLSPENDGADHLTILAKISRILKDVSMCSEIRKSKNRQEIYKFLENM